MPERIPILRHRAAARLHEIRKARGLLQRDLAAAARVSAAQISRWENGAAEFSFAEAVLICERLEIWTVDLLVPAGAPIPPHRSRIKISTAFNSRKDYGWDDPLEECMALWHQLREELQAEHGIDIGDAWMLDWINIIRERMGVVEAAPPRQAAARHERIQKRLIAYHHMAHK